MLWCQNSLTIPALRKSCFWFRVTRVCIHGTWGEETSINGARIACAHRITLVRMVCAWQFYFWWSFANLFIFLELPAVIYEYVSLLGFTTVYSTRLKRKYLTLTTGVGSPACDLTLLRRLVVYLRSFSTVCLLIGVSTFVTGGLGSSVGIVTAYGLDGPGIESRWGRDFPHLSRPALRPTQPPVQWVPGLFLGVRCCRGVTLTPQPLLVPRSKIE